jgi:serine protease
MTRLTTKGAARLRALAVCLMACAAGLAAAAEAQVTDRIIVKYRTAAAGESARLAQGRPAELSAQRFGVTMSRLRTTALGSQVLEVNRQLTLAEAARLAADIAASDPNVEYAEPDRLLQHTLTPDDPRYNEQWHYFEPAAGINAPPAWDKATGSGMVVAVLDTGYRPHADLAKNVLSGYDFISNAFMANDGTGRDSDARDPGDWVDAGACRPGLPPVFQSSSWHGTHVAGTIAARTNNSVGVGGVAFDARILPVRVLGRCGGFTSDIADGIVWASGGTVAGVPANTNPARVINLSLGGLGDCSITSQNAINAARARGSVVVASAGNSRSDVALFNPANCGGVVTVAAVDRTGGWTWYTNTGAIVALAAPGGDGAEDADSVLSTLNTGVTTPGADDYAFYDGTSMAAPHVSGVVALMLSVRSGLTPDEVTQILQGTARPFPATCVGCGAGIVDANAAVDAALATCANHSEELVIIQNNIWNAVDNTTGRRTSIPCVDWSNPEAMASTRGHIFTIQGGEMWKTNGATGATVSLGSGWGGAEAMAAVDGVVYTVWGDLLWRTIAEDGNTWAIDHTWSGTNALAAGLLPSGRFVFGVQGGVLWKVNGDSGVSIGRSSGWEGTEAMTYGEGFLYIVCNDELWKVDAESGQRVALIRSGWSGTEAMTYRNGSVYAVQGGRLRRVLPSGMFLPTLSDGWAGTQVMTAVVAN